MSTAMRQTGAMFVDAYRELAAGRLFWITLALSGLIAGVFGAVGIDQEGMTALWFRIPVPGLNSEVLPPAVLYKFLFFQFGLGIWLTWIATILALVTTAGIIPQLVSSGTIDSMIAKPIGRSRLFLTRCATGLTFAAMQVTLFTSVAFLVIGIRGGEWLWTLFLAIPIVVVFFSYLFAIMALIGLVTRSTITSLLLTLLIWFMLFIVNTVDGSLVQFQEGARLRQDALQQRIAEVEANTQLQYAAQKRREGVEIEEGYVATPDELDSINPFLPLMRSSLDESLESQRELDPWVDGLFLAKTVLPKTSETIGLLSRSIMSEEDLEAILGAFSSNDDRTEIDEETGRVDVPQSELSRSVNERMESRSLVWVLGTSLMFEFIVLGVCCVVFARRDF
ncbi:MAG: hypothetical protein AAGF47_06750 [Planctomycetota bacterium]